MADCSNFDITNPHSIDTEVINNLPSIPSTVGINIDSIIATGGIFDKLSDAILQKLVKQFQENRIPKGDLAEIMKSAIMGIMEQSVKAEIDIQNFELTKVQTELAITKTHEELLYAKNQARANANLAFAKTLTEKLNACYINAKIDTEAQELLLKQKETELKEQEIQLKQKEVELRQKQIEVQQELVKTEPYNRAKIHKQTELFIRQMKGFDDDANIKLFDSLWKSWAAMVMADPDAERIPDIILKTDAMERMYKDIYNRTVGSPAPELNVSGAETPNTYGNANPIP